MNSDSKTYRAYLISKTGNLIKIFTEFKKDTPRFVNDIDKWDWEIENTIEGYALLSEGIVLAKNSERRVSVRDDRSVMYGSLKILIDTWNSLLDKSSSEYEDNNSSGDDLVYGSDVVSIDFELYYKKV